MEKDLATYSVQCAEVIDNAPVLVDDSDDVDIPVGQKRGRAPISEAVDDAAASPSSTNSIVDDYERIENEKRETPYLVLLLSKFGFCKKEQKVQWFFSGFLE
jgi:hypothetical protein